MIKFFSFVLIFISCFLFADAFFLLCDIIGYLIPDKDGFRHHYFEDIFRYYYPRFICDRMFGNEDDFHHFIER